MPRLSRQSRTAESRGLGTRRNNANQGPADKHRRDLDIPLKDIPPGMVYSWLRISVHNEADHGNWQKKVGKGWKPVPRERHADRFPLLNVPGLSDARYDSVIVFGGLILVERPKRDVENDLADIADETAEQVNSVDWDTRDDKAFTGVPRFNDSSKLQIERSVAEFKDDEE